MGKNKIKVTGFRIPDETILKKLDVIAKKHYRNRNQEVVKILTDHVKEYELEHGEIKVEEES